MWRKGFISNLAETAKKAAANLEAQVDDSMEVPQKQKVLENDDSNMEVGMNDGWDHEDDDDAYFDDDDDDDDEVKEEKDGLAIPAADDGVVEEKEDAGVAAALENTRELDGDHLDTKHMLMEEEEPMMKQQQDEMVLTADEKTDSQSDLEHHVVHNDDGAASDRTEEEEEEPSNIDPQTTKEEQEHQSQEALSSQPPATDTTTASFSSDEIDEANQAIINLRFQLTQQSTQMQTLESTLSTRESQLASKSNEIATLLNEHTIEKDSLKLKIKETKEEAKKRIKRAKDKADEMQSRLDAATTGDGGGDDAEQIINALREEGQLLAQKQSTMEQTVRASRAESRELTNQLEESQQDVKTKDTKIATLEAKVLELSQQLSQNQNSVTKVTTLESELITARDEVERGIATRLSLDAQLKDSQKQITTLTHEIQTAKQTSNIQTSKELQDVKQSHGVILQDMHQKINLLEKETSLREDALRHEISELRKRWQDAVRRADGLSMDVRDATAPLMRQLESAERQGRVRASAAAEVEEKLRRDLESVVLENERVKREKAEFMMQIRTLERRVNEMELEIKNEVCQKEELEQEYQNLAKQMEEHMRKEEEWVKVEKSISDNALKAKNDMMKHAMSNEERYRNEIEDLREVLQKEKHRRMDLEGSLNDLVGQSRDVLYGVNHSDVDNVGVGKEKELITVTNQADILQSTLVGLDGDDDTTTLENTTTTSNNDDDNNPTTTNTSGGGGGSWAAMEQLSQGLTTAKLELKSLRKQIQSNEQEKQYLLNEITSLRQTTEKLPLFEAKVSQLAKLLDMKEKEIIGLREDMKDVKCMYRDQLDSLLNEKAGPEEEESLHLASVMEDEEEEEEKEEYNNDHAGSESETEDENDLSFTTTDDIMAANFL